jgi:hypothetical protein
MTFILSMADGKVPTAQHVRSQIHTIYFMAYQKRREAGSSSMRFAGSFQITSSLHWIVASFDGFQSAFI